MWNIGDGFRKNSLCPDVFRHDTCSFLQLFKCRFSDEGLCRINWGSNYILSMKPVNEQSGVILIHKVYCLYSYVRALGHKRKWVWTLATQRKILNSLTETSWVLVTCPDTEAMKLGAEAIPGQGAQGLLSTSSAFEFAGSLRSLVVADRFNHERSIYQPRCWSCFCTTLFLGFRKQVLR